MAKVIVALLASPDTTESSDRWRLTNELATDAVDMRTVDATMSDGELIEQLADVDAVLPWRSDLPVEIVRHCKNLKLVQLLTAGFDMVDVAGLAEIGVAVANNGGANAISVSEHTISLMLAVYRRLMDAWENARIGKWRRDIDNLPFRAEINGKTVGIVGFGNIGRQVARRLQGWEAELLYYDAFDPPASLVAGLGARRSSFEDLLSVSDIVTLHVPLSRSTTGMIGERELELMKSSSILINTCRGEVVEEAALIRALRIGQIAGAGLDVLETEPPDPESPLLKARNVVVTPHWAGGTREGSARAIRFAMSNFQRLADGVALQSVVELEE